MDGVSEEKEEAASPARLCAQESAEPREWRAAHNANCKRASARAHTRTQSLLLSLSVCLSSGWTQSSLIGRHVCKQNK